MIRVALAIIATMGVAGSVGCRGLHQPFMHSSNCGCDSCGSAVPGPPSASLIPTDGQHACLGCGAKHQARKAARRATREEMMRGPNGPPVGAVSYPYYTTRGPRDFFVDHPQGIGP